MNRLSYLVREALINMRRNALVVTGAVLAVFVSLALALSALVVNELVRENTIQWRDGVHIIVWLKDAQQGITTESHLELLEEVQSFTEVEEAFYVDKVAAFQEFQRIFADQPTVVENTDPSRLPASIRIKLLDLEEYRNVQFRLIGQAPVREVQSPGQAIENLTNLSNVLNLLGFGLAIVQGAAAVVLISNTIRMAIYARREEVAVMKLVGASNWFIRIPFLIEGMLEGLIGAALAVAAVFLARNRLADVDGALQLFQLTVSDGFFLRWSVLFLLFGAGAGVLGSALGLRRFLKV